MTRLRVAPQDAALLPTLFAVEDTHWWAAGMRRVSHALLDGVSLPPGWIAEIGCGAGAFAAELAQRYPDREVLAVDLHPAALVAAAGRTGQQAGLHVGAADGQRLPLPDACCGLVVALDVLDQARIDPAQALAEIRRVLRPGGWLLLRVSAYPWLLGPHDRAFGTARRYNRVRVGRDAGARRAGAGAPDLCQQPVAAGSRDGTAGAASPMAAGDGRIDGASPTQPRADTGVGLGGGRFAEPQPGVGIEHLRPGKGDRLTFNQTLQVAGNRRETVLQFSYIRSPMHPCKHLR